MARGERAGDALLQGKPAPAAAGKKPGGGAGICICPNSFLSGENLLFSSRLLDQTTVFPLRCQEGSHWITVSRLRGKYLTQAARAFIQVAKDLYRTSESEG